MVEEEIERLRATWNEVGDRNQYISKLLTEEQVTCLDRFAYIQLEDVLRVCLQSRNLSEAGRKLFAKSRSKRTIPNDADRLRKYLDRFNLMV